MKTALIDANIIVRFLVGDDEKLYEKSAKVFESSEKGKQKAIVCEAVLMEVYVVRIFLTTDYGLCRYIF